jgi:hypothetical protein
MPVITQIIGRPIIAKLGTIDRGILKIFFRVKLRTKINSNKRRILTNLMAVACKLVKG